MQFQIGHELLALERKRPDVHILPISAAFQEIDGDLAHVVGGVRQLHTQDACAAMEALEVFPQAEYVGLAVGLVPVAADALEYGRAIVQRVSHYTDTCIG